MAENSKNQFNPDYAVHPGEILEETLQARSITNRELSARSGLTEKHISQIINGKAPVTPDTAIMLERILGVPADLWLKLDLNYRLFILKKTENAAWEKQLEWAGKFPYKELMKRKFLPQTRDLAKIVEPLLAFLGYGSIAAWQSDFAAVEVKYRKAQKFQCANESLAAWLKIGERTASEIETKPFNRANFIDALKKIRPLTQDDREKSLPELSRLCAEAGVAVAFVKELPGTHLSGAAYWLSSEKALIILSLRYKTDDHFWFTFFHEAGHILLHGKTGIIIDGKELSGNEQEHQANRFAADFLIPEEAYTGFVMKHIRIGESAIRLFASGLEIAPGIVVGRLQKDKRIPYTWHNSLKRKFA